jgi:hypothetical protein
MWFGQLTAREFRSIE